MKSLNNYQISEMATIGEAITLIQKNTSRCVFVTSANQKVIGAFSEGDVLRAIMAGVDLHTPLRGLIKPSFRYLTDCDQVAARKLLLDGITLIPVLDHEFRLESVITLKDVFEP